MKPRILLTGMAIMLIFSALSLKGASAWVVAPSGGNFTSINTAVNSGTVLSGDTVYIKNSAVGASAQGNTLFSENVSIPAGKSLEIIAYNQDTVFSCQGNWTITPQSSGSMTVDIVGMNNTGGLSSTAAVISLSAAGPSSANRCVVRLLGGCLGSGLTTATSGYIAFNYDNADLTVYGLSIKNSTNNPGIQFRHGTVLGDSIVVASGGASSHAISVQSEGAAGSDTCFIIANVITLTDGSAGANGNAGVYWNSNSMFFEIFNNLIFSNDHGIYISQTRASSATVNRIVNNTTSWTSSNNSSYNAFGIYTNCNASGFLEIVNNCVARNTTGASTSGNYGIYCITGVTNVFYNYIDKNFTNILSLANGSQFYNTINQGPITLGTGALVNTTSYPPSTGALGYQSSSAFGINSGMPANGYANLDKTANTVGAFGGSYSLYNFFPLNTSSARVWMTNFPTNGSTGNNLSIKAISFDR